MAPPRPAGTDPRWREVRAIVLARDNQRCKECGELCPAGEADVHHLVPRAAWGIDEPANLITLCDGCHAARHPNLQGSLARRAIERWGLRLAKWVDRRGDLTAIDESLGATLRLLGVTRFRPHQLEVVLAALRGESIKSREALLDEARDRDYDVFDRSIEVHISSLCKKLHDDAKQPRYIRTVRSAGYMMVGPE